MALVDDPGFYGEERLVTKPFGPTVSRFLADGHFLKRFGGTPRFTRISAVVGLEDFSWYPKLQTVVLHNPHSQTPVDISVFGDWRQFVPVQGEMRWTSENVVRV